MFKLKYNVKIDIMLVITLFLPVFWEQLASILLTMISSMISTNIDTNFLNATSMVGSVFGPFTTLYGCVASGSAILISQYIGANDNDRSRSLFSTSMLIGTAISVVIAVIVVLFRNPILRSTYSGMSETFFTNANIYSVFYAITLPMGFFRTNMIGILRGCLNTKGPLYISLFGGVIDIALKWLLMVVFEMGIVGLGLASVLTNLFFTVICAVIIGKTGNFKGCVKGAFSLYRNDVAKEVMKIGAVMCAQSFIVSIGGLVLSKIFAGMGDDHVSAFSITTSVESIIHLVPLALAYVVQILAGKYTGAGEKKQALNISVWVTVASTFIHIALSLIAFLFAKQLVGMYTNNETVTAIATETLKIGLIIMPLGWSGGNVLPAGIRGMGNVKFPALVLVLSLWLYKIPATWYACSVLDKGAQGRMLVYAIEFMVYTLCFVGYTLYAAKKINKVTGDTPCNEKQ